MMETDMLVVDTLVVDDVKRNRQGSISRIEHAITGAQEQLCKLVAPYIK
jgi:hypothetical protein